MDVGYSSNLDTPISDSSNSEAVSDPKCEDTFWQMYKYWILVSTIVILLGLAITFFVLWHNEKDQLEEDLVKITKLERDVSELKDDNKECQSDLDKIKKEKEEWEEDKEDLEKKYDDAKDDLEASLAARITVTNELNECETTRPVNCAACETSSSSGAKNDKSTAFSHLDNENADTPSISSSSSRIKEIARLRVNRLKLQRERNAEKKKRLESQ